MDESKSLSLFIENLRGEVLSGAAFSTDGEEGKFSEEAFTDYVCEILVEEAEEVTSDISLCTHQSRGVKLNAWHLNDQENELTLIVTHYSNINDGGKTDRLSKTEIDKRFKRAKRFFDESVSLTETIQNIRDVSKVFTDFTKPFSLPASETNNSKSDFIPA